MRVLVTGAAGFLGRAFAEHHVGEGDYVVGVDDMSSPYARWGEGYIREVEDAGLYFASSSLSYDLAYHFAAPVGGREKIEGDPLFNADSLRLDAAFFRWAIGHTKTAIYPSSSAVYGKALQAGQGHPLSESYFHPAQLDWGAPDELYGFTKMTGEILAYNAAKYGLRTLCIRPFSGYGPGQSLEYPVPSILERVRRRDDPLVIWGTGEQRRDFIYISDIVGATVARVNNGVEGYQSMNIGTGAPWSFNQIANLAAGIVGYSPKIVHDETKPQGVNSRFCNPTLLFGYYRPDVPLNEGLESML